ncbi:MAG: AAA family ATPase [Clostridia bacterium]|nr:AAA family ATPase [Clostridia bacterium]
MSLQIIYGTAGTGKTTYLFEQVQEKIKQNTKYPIKIITPEQFSFTAEKQLLATAHANSMLAAEVITFARMAYRILNEVGGKTRSHLGSSGRNMLINYILLTKKNDFAFLGSSDENVELVARQLTEFKKHQVSVENLKQIIENTKDQYLKTKLQEITRIYELYTNTVSNNYIDENDGLTLLAQKLENSKEFKNCDIYIDEFAGFTTQEYEIIRKLLKQSYKVTITICSDSLQEATNPDIDVFYENKKTAAKIIEIAKQEQVPIEEPICLNEPKRFKAKELQHLAKSMGEPFYKRYEGEVQEVSLLLSNNPYSEIEQLATKITKLAKQGYRYEQIAVITKDINTYGSLCKVIFSYYGIPVFIDEKKDLSNNLLAKYILALLEIFAKNWSYEAVFGYIKTDFHNLEEREIAILENYCLKWGIKGNKWYAKQWSFYDETEEEKQTILYAKSQIIEPLLEFKKQLQGTKTVKEITTSLYEFLKKNKVQEKLIQKIEQLKEEKQIEKAKEYEMSFQIVLDLLDEIVLVLGEETITFDRYAKIFKMGLGQSDLGTIPATSDQVIVGDVDRSRSHKIRALFLIGLNDGKFPSVQKEEGFIDDNDREVLKKQGIELAKGTLEQLYDDNFNIYKAFTTAEEKLYLSYVSSDSEGKSLRPSMLINKIKRIFPNLKEQSDVVKKTSEILLKNVTFDELLVQLRKLREGEEIEPIWYQVYEYYLTNEPEKLKQSMQAIEYQNIPEKLTQQNLQKLYGNTLKTSVSRLEQYRACAFSYYLKYGLKLKEKSTFQVNTIDTGNFMHEVIDRFFERLEEENISVKQIKEEQIKSITEEIVEEKLSLKKYDIFR